MKLYLVLAPWPVTKNNHAGMFYLAKQIKKQLQIPVKILQLPVWNLGYLYPLYRLYAFILGLYLRIIVKKDDTVWLMEYLLKTTEQSRIAKLLKGRVNLLGLAHLVPELISKQYSDSKIKKNIDYLDKLYVLGSSLKNYFISKGLKDNQIEVTFHYVDTSFYSPKVNKSFNSNITVICMGNMQRDYSQLQTIIQQCENVNFTICAGRHNVNAYFAKFKNVTIVGYIEEEELKKLMQSSDLSLNVMKDTIGSNVIVSSLACGLPVIASNVGSIKDYVDDGINGCLFDNPKEAASIINMLAKDKKRLSDLSKAARIKAEQISLNNFIESFSVTNKIN